ncbi:MAG: hypothetical protein QNJ55_02545 [Xenococcus sp. MO_188.B8]|nr:hypothetical protein [Xenococcus sp. MO_188.B8]
MANTTVDQAETESELAMAINDIVLEIMGEIATESLQLLCKFLLIISWMVSIIVTIEKISLTDARKLELEKNLTVI